MDSMKHEREEESEAEIKKSVTEMLAGSYYVTHYASGKMQVNLDASGSRAWTKLEVLWELGKLET